MDGVQRWNNGSTYKRGLVQLPVYHDVVTGVLSNQLVPAVEELQAGAGELVDEEPMYFETKERRESTEQAPPPPPF